MLPGPTLLAAAGGFALAWKSRPKLRVTRHRVLWPGLARPRVVAHVTDVHVGWSTPQVLLDEVVEAIEGESPDLVALTGDYVNTSRIFFSRMQSFVRRMPAPVVAVLGNHDHLVGGSAIGLGLEAAGATVLRNQQVEIAGLTVVGVDDGFTGHANVEEAFAGLPQGAQVLVLTHFPPTAKAIAGRGGRLVLAGHTHSGQFDLPWGWTERLARIALLGSYLRGFFELQNGVQLYVNAGLGHSRRGMRLGEMCRPELAVFRLEDRQALTEIGGPVAGR